MNKGYVNVRRLSPNSFIVWPDRYENTVLPIGEGT